MDADLKKPTYYDALRREFPQAPDAEKAVLSSILLSPNEVIGLLQEAKVTKETFYIPAHGEIYEALVDLWSTNKPIDFITIAQYLKDRNKLDAVGGPSLLNMLFTFMPTAANVGYYVEILMEKHVLREIIKAGNEYSSRAYDEMEEVGLLRNDFEAAVMKIGRQNSSRIIQPKEAVMKALGRVHQLYDRKGQIGGLATGFTKFDQMTDGLKASELIVIAARPSMGKTAFAMNLVEHVAVQLRHPVHVFSLEMSSDQLWDRLLYSMARVDASRIRGGFLAERDYPAITGAAQYLQAAPIYVDDGSNQSIQEMRAKARRMKALYDTKMVVVDYLQIAKSATKRAQENRQLEIAEISGGLKAMAKELGIPVVALAQISRQVENRANPEPRLSDLKESGAIEQDADVVGMIHRPEYYVSDEEEKRNIRGQAKLIIAKQRNGPTGDVPLTFISEYARFENRSDQPEPEA